MIEINGHEVTATGGWFCRKADTGAVFTGCTLLPGEDAGSFEECAAPTETTEDTDGADTAATPAAISADGESLAARVAELEEKLASLTQGAESETATSLKNNAT